MFKGRKKLFGVLAGAMLVCMLGITACANNATAPAGSAGSAPVEAGSGAAELFGKPWVMSQVSGNLPTAQPEAKDDLYTHYNYGYMSEHQGEDVTYITSSSDEVKNATVAAIEDGSRTDHDLEQMRIFYNQALDTETLKELGFSEVKPYIDRIDSAGSIEEFNAVLTAEDFPFTPFVMATLGVTDMHKDTAVNIFPNLLLCDPVIEGGTYYQDNPQYEVMLQMKAALKLAEADLVMEGEFDPIELADQVVAFEKSYAKYADNTSKYLAADYGAYTQAVKDGVFTLDELCELCPDIPMREMLAKCRKDGASSYCALSPEWIGALNGLWTEENLDMLKTVAKFKVLDETHYFRDQSAAMEMLGEDGPAEGEGADPKAAAYLAINDIDTFAQVIAKEYSDNVLGDQGKERLEKVTSDILDAYKELLSDTAWLSTESQELVEEKLDRMTMNILEPAGGYLDFSGLELTPTEEGGTLFTNYLKLKQYRLDREAERIGTPAAGDWVWFALAPTMENAFYDPQSNSINILPGIVTSSLYTNEMSDTEAIAGIGWVVAHEISHGFDYTGSQTDAYGLPNQVFAEEDLEIFLAKCGALAERYNQVEFLPGKTLDGQNVVGEAAADLSGLQACLVLAEKAGDTDYDAFFKRAATNWAQVVGDRFTFESYALDTHPLMNLRINVNAQMFDELYDKLGVSEGDGMYLAPDERVVIWGEKA